MRRVSLPIILCNLLVLGAALVATGCGTHASVLRDVRSEFYAGQVVAAQARIEKQLERKRHDSDVLKLDHALVQLCSGRAKEAERTLREVRDTFDHLEQASLAEGALSMATDDRARAYSGEDYEKVLIRAFLAISNLMHDGGDAVAYSLQISEKQNQIILAGGPKKEDNLKLGYKRVGLGAYLHASIIESSHSNFDDLVRARQKVLEWEPEFPFAQPDLQRATEGRHSALGNGVVYVIGLVGRGPYKEEVAELPTQVALLIADRIISATSKYSLPPTIAPVRVPKVVLGNHLVDHLAVSINNQPVGRTGTITDIGRTAIQQYDAVYPEIIARAVVRRVIKKGVIYGAKEVTGIESHSLANIAFDVAGVVWEATEVADTRCWGLLPDKIQVLRIELPAGTYSLGLAPRGSSTINVGKEELRTIEVVNGDNTYVLANFPDTKLVGKVLTSRDPPPLEPVVEKK